jgi:putative spermidine/putrescine transport system permease protein
MRIRSSLPLALRVAGPLLIAILLAFVLLPVVV